MKDRIDQRIIQLLQQNARIPFTKIGAEVGLSSAAVADRVRK
ncbi:MAG: AsnC family protein, partial [Flavobacteriaceae bacterium]